MLFRQERIPDGAAKKSNCMVGTQFEALFVWLAHEYIRQPRNISNELCSVI